MKRFSEYADFGLDITKKPKMPEDENLEKPLAPLSVEYVVGILRKKHLGERYVVPNDFFGEIQWGVDDGAIRLEFTPLGGVKAIMRKLIHDLEGNPTWICKKVVEVKNTFDAHPDKLVYQLEENLVEMNQEGLDMPVADFKDMQRLVIHLASDLRRYTTQKIFIYEGIRVIKENYKYIIHFGVTGMGVQAAGQRRVDQFAIHAEYHQNTGLIKITGTELGDSIDKHRWVYSPSNFVEYFSPNQKQEEINKAILVEFNCF